MGIFDVEESNPTIMWNNISSSANNDLATSPYNPLTLTPLKLTLKESTSWRLVHDEGKWWRPHSVTSDRFFLGAGHVQ